MAETTLKLVLLPFPRKCTDIDVAFTREFTWDVESKE
jgi:hypothetical protein